MFALPTVRPQRRPGVAPIRHHEAESLRDAVLTVGEQLHAPTGLNRLKFLLMLLYGRLRASTQYQAGSGSTATHGARYRNACKSKQTPNVKTAMANIESSRNHLRVITYAELGMPATGRAVQRPVVEDQASPDIV